MTHDYGPPGWVEYIEQLEQRIAHIRAVVNEQANDGGLWFVAETAAEGYLQQELRKLHKAVEEER